MALPASLRLLLATIVLLATAAHGAVKTQTYSGSLTTRPYDDPRVVGFDGKAFTYNSYAVLPSTINIASVRQWRLFGELKKGHTEGTAALASVMFQRFDLVQAAVMGDRLAVKLNYKPLLPSKVAIRGGNVTYVAPEYGRDRVVLIEHASLKIRITQPFSAQLVKYQRWLDVRVTLAHAAGVRVSGILGRTVPQ